MHLRSLRLLGFKSFPEVVEIRLEPGVAVVVGPNGSGKSNVADAIVWAAGSLTPSELRAEKPDDVLFAGGGDRKPADHCEVELIFDNEDGALGELPFTEVSIARRLHRGGEGQYLVNRTAVRRTDLVELLADVGLGGSMHSIVGQGKVDAVLASRPEDRRALVEEAAGLGKFKRRKHRAELKLARVATQVERAIDVEQEVRKRLRPLALQATAAERAEKLRGEIARLHARVAELDLGAVASRRAEAEERRMAAALARRGAAERLQALLEERQRAEDELGDAAGRREAALGALYRLRSTAERIEVRRESAEALHGRVASDLSEVEAAAAAQDAGATAELRGGGARRPRLRHVRRRRPAVRLRSGHASRTNGSPRWSGKPRGSPESGWRHSAIVARRPRPSSPRWQAARRERALLRLGGVRERAGGAPGVGAAVLADGLRRELAEARELAGRGGPTPAELEEAADEAGTAARAAATERDDLAERARAARERLAALERSLAEREGIPPAARALAEQGQRLALSLVEPEPGRERAVAAALGPRASAVLAGDAAAGLDLLRHARDAGLGSLTVLVGADPAELVGVAPCRAARRAARLACARGHDRGLRLRPRARRALVRGRGGRGGAPRAAGPAPCARGRGGRARRSAPPPHARLQPRPRRGRPNGRGGVRGGRAPARRPGSTPSALARLLVRRRLARVACSPPPWPPRSGSRRRSASARPTDADRARRARRSACGGSARRSPS